MVIQKLQEKLRILKGRTIGLLGLAFPTALWWERRTAKPWTP
jgi:hypothetical protein